MADENYCNMHLVINMAENAPEINRMEPQVKGLNQGLFV